MFLPSLRREKAGTPGSPPAVPLADLVTSTCLARFDRDMKFIDGKFNALDAVAPLIAAIPAHDVGRQIARAAEHTGLTTAEVTDAVTRAIPRVIGTTARGRGRR